MGLTNSNTRHADRGSLVNIPLSGQISFSGEPRSMCRVPGVRAQSGNVSRLIESKHMSQGGLLAAAVTVIGSIVAAAAIFLYAVCFCPRSSCAASGSSTEELLEVSDSFVLLSHSRAPRFSRDAAEHSGG